MRNYILLLAFIFVTTFYGCKKDNVAKPTNISNAQAATMVATALAVNANGLVNIKNDVTLYAKNLASSTGKGCGVIDSFAVARQEAASSTINYNYALGYYYVVNCNNNIQDNLNSNVIYNGSFDAADLAEVNSVNSTLNVSSLADASVANFSLNGNHQTTGSFQTLDEAQLSGNNVINIDVKNLLVKKSNRAIVSGTANISVSGSVKNKNTFIYNGSLVFKDATTAILTLEGTNYTINTTTAQVTAI